MEKNGKYGHNMGNMDINGEIWKNMENMEIETHVRGLKPSWKCAFRAFQASPNPEKNGFPFYGFP
jgi:hypothetical protein